MNTQLLLFLFLTIISFESVGQDIQARSLPFFNKINYEGYGSIFLEPSDAPAIKILPSNDFAREHVRTEVRNETLYVWSDLKTTLNNGFDQQGIDVYLYYPELKQLTLNGKIRVDGIHSITTDHFSIDASGDISLRLPVEAKKLTAKFKGEINAALTGKVNHEVIDFKGKGSINTLALNAQSAQITTDGKAEIFLPYIPSIQAIASGLSEIIYQKNPACRVNKIDPKHPKIKVNTKRL